MSAKIEIFYEATPNPQSMKFNVTAQIANETIAFSSPALASRSPLAQKLFGFPWAQAVMIGPMFVTITKQEWVEWSTLADPLASLITEHLERGEGVLIDLPEGEESTEVKENQINADDSIVVKQIKDILNKEIRPAVAMDGGDILFSRYEDKKLYLHLRGSCSGCPSSVMTLKDGIESRMKQSIPDLEEVIDESTI